MLKCSTARPAYQQTELCRRLCFELSNWITTRSERAEVFRNFPKFSRIIQKFTETLTTEGSWCGGCGEKYKTYEITGGTGAYILKAGCRGFQNPLIICRWTQKLTVFIDFYWFFSCDLHTFSVDFLKLKSTIQRLYRF